MARTNPYEPEYDNAIDQAIMGSGGRESPSPFAINTPGGGGESGGAGEYMGEAGGEIDPPSLPRVGGFAPTTGPRAPRLGGQGQGRGSFTFQPPDASAFKYGWDFGRHAGNTYSYDNPAEGAKYAFADYAREAGLNPGNASSSSIAEALNSRYGSAVFQPEGDRRVRFGDEFVDWSGEGKPAGQFFWGSASSAPSGPSGGAAPAGNPGGLASGGGFGAGGRGGGGSISGNAGGESQIHDAIMRLLSRGEQPVDEASVSSQYLPARNAMERQGQIARAQLAQRGAVQGTNIGGGGGALEGEINSLNENLASSEGQLMAGLIGEELSSRRQDVAQALNFAQGEQRMGLQKMLADIDAQLRSRGLDLQGRGLDLQGRGLGLQERQLNQQNQQFYDRFGYDAGLQEYLLSQLFNQGLA